MKYPSLGWRTHVSVNGGGPVQAPLPLWLDTCGPKRLGMSVLLVCYDYEFLVDKMFVLHEFSDYVSRCSRLAWLHFSITFLRSHVPAEPVGDKFFINFVSFCLTTHL